MIGRTVPGDRYLLILARHDPLSRLSAGAVSRYLTTRRVTLVPQVGSGSGADEQSGKTRSLLEEKEKWSEAEVYPGNKGKLGCTLNYRTRWQMPVPKSTGRCLRRYLVPYLEPATVQIVEQCRDFCALYQVKPRRHFTFSAEKYHCDFLPDCNISHLQRGKFTFSSPFFFFLFFCLQVDWNSTYLNK